jgi:hypothetical protein
MKPSSPYRRLCAAWRATKACGAPSICACVNSESVRRPASGSASHTGQHRRPGQCLGVSRLWMRRWWMWVGGLIRRAVVVDSSRRGGLRRDRRIGARLIGPDGGVLAGAGGGAGSADPSPECAAVGPACCLVCRFSTLRSVRRTACDVRSGHFGSGGADSGPAVFGRWGDAAAHDAFDGHMPEPVRHSGHAAKYRERLPDAVDYLLFGAGRIAFEEFTEVGRHTEDEPVLFVRQHQPAWVPRE